MTFNPTFVNQITSAGKQVTGKSTPTYLLARVTHVVNGPFFQGTQFPDPNYKDPTDIGSVLYVLVNTSQNRTLQAAGNPPAKPINSAIKQYPAEGEFILLFQGPSTSLNTSRERESPGASQGQQLQPQKENTQTQREHRNTTKAAGHQQDTRQP